MKMYMINLDNWKIGGDRSRNKISTKKAYPDMATFLPNLGKKITGFEIWKRFGGGLKDPNIW
jgi:hypothetical protein